MISTEEKNRNNAERERIAYKEGYRDGLHGTVVVAALCLVCIIVIIIV